MNYSKDPTENSLTPSLTQTPLEPEKLCPAKMYRKLLFFFEGQKCLRIDNFIWFN